MTIYCMCCHMLIGEQDNYIMERIDAVSFFSARWNVYIRIMNITARRAPRVALFIFVRNRA